jgi:hypothetical protein
MKLSDTRSGFTGLEIAAALAVLAGVAWLVKPSLFPGASKRAATSTEATAQLVAATDAQGASAAASVTKIGQANSDAPESPARSFIAQEVPVALSRLPTPDPKALLEAERRRSAVMEGRLDEARALYERTAKESAKLQRERDEALAARRAADLALEQAAAAEHARTVQLLAAGIVAFLLLAGWIYSKVYSITPDAIGKIAADVRAGIAPLTALDTHLSPKLHARVSRAAKLATELKDS